MPEIVSVNVGRAGTLEWSGRRVVTAFVKHPTRGPIRVLADHLEGDEQADPTVHGGPRKAVYAYCADHYPLWASELPGVALPWGSFGENLSIRGLSEDEVRVGDRWRAGTAVLEVVQPRSPCYKLNARFGRDDMIDRFWAARRSGFYLGVITEGIVQAGNEFQRISTRDGAPTIADEVERRYRATRPG